MSEVTINWFEIPATNVAAAVGFYEAVLGISLGEMPGPEGEAMRVFMTAEGPSGALVAAGDGMQPGANGPRVYLNCPDIDAALGRVASAGGKVVSERTPIGPHGFIGSLEDPDGNLVALHTSTA